MGSWTWKIRELGQKIVPFLIIGAIGFGAYKLHRQGMFRHGVGPAINTVLHQIPYFGSRFKHYNAASEGYAVSPRKATVRKKYRHTKRNYGHRRGRGKHRHQQHR